MAVAGDVGVPHVELRRGLAVLGVDHLDDVGNVYLAVAVGITGKLNRDEPVGRK